MLHELLFYNTSTRPKGKDMPLNFKTEFILVLKRSFLTAPKLLSVFMLTTF